MQRYVTAWRNSADATNRAKAIGSEKADCIRKEFIFASREAAAEHARDEYAVTGGLPADLVVVRVEVGHHANLNCYDGRYFQYDWDSAVPAREILGLDRPT